MDIGGPGKGERRWTMGHVNESEGGAQGIALSTGKFPVETRDWERYTGCVKGGEDTGESISEMRTPRAQR